MASRILFSGSGLKFTAKGDLFVEDNATYFISEVEPKDVKQLYEAMKEYFESDKIALPAI